MIPFQRLVKSSLTSWAHTPKARAFNTFHSDAGRRVLNTAFNKWLGPQVFPHPIIGCSSAESMHPISPAMFPHSHPHQDHCGPEFPHEVSLQALPDKPSRLLHKPKKQECSNLPSSNSDGAQGYCTHSPVLQSSQAQPRQVGLSAAVCF